MRYLSVPLALALTSAGCFTQVQRIDKHWDLVSPSQCTDRYHYVFGDVAIGIAGTAGGLALATQIGDLDNRKFAAISSLVFGLIFVTFAGASYDSIERCIRIKESWAIHHAEQLRR